MCKNWPGAVDIIMKHLCYYVLPLVLCKCLSGRGREKEGLDEEVLGVANGQGQLR